MIKLIPECNENIIVGVLYNGIFNWYVTDKEIWFLDYKKRIIAFKDKGFDIEEYIDDVRKDTLIMNSDNVSTFLKRIEIYKIESECLRELLEKRRASNDDSWCYDFSPSLYVDFDSNKLFSLYSEPASYEEYVPTSWEGRYFDFMYIIPYNYKYWLKEEKNLLMEE